MWVRPPRGGSWTSVLPDEWHRNPYVVLIYVPVGAKFKLAQSKVGDNELVLIEHDGKYQGVQVRTPKLNGYADHQDVFDGARVHMARPQYIGRLEELPQSYLMSDLQPVLLHRDAMHRPYLNLRRHLGRDPKNAN